MEKVRMEEVEIMAVELLPDREEMQTTINIDSNVSDNAAAGQTGANGFAVAVNTDEA
jgi:hypothetical protein